MADAKPSKEPAMHQMVQPLSWILGKWKGVNGSCVFPTIMEKRIYDEEIEFSTMGQPNIHFNAMSWLSEKKVKTVPLHV